MTISASVFPGVFLAQQRDQYAMPVGQDFESFMPLEPIEEAVRAVQEAQDAVGKDIWENE